LKSQTKERARGIVDARGGAGPSGLKRSETIKILNNKRNEFSDSQGKSIKNFLHLKKMGPMSFNI